MYAIPVQHCTGRSYTGRHYTAVASNVNTTRWSVGP
uniref:Uncharacterized protein n=1 Tax=Anguilla anguilla TaxID=7936 RepID=A0A0E9TR50_ANGAN